MECVRKQQLNDRLLGDKLIDIGRCKSILASPLTNIAKAYL